MPLFQPKNKTTTPEPGLIERTKQERQEAASRVSELREELSQARSEAWRLEEAAKRLPHGPERQQLEWDTRNAGDRAAELRAEIETLEEKDGELASLVRDLEREAEQAEARIRYHAEIIANHDAAVKAAEEELERTRRNHDEAVQLRQRALDELVERLRELTGEDAGTGS